VRFLNRALAISLGFRCVASAPHRRRSQTAAYSGLAICRPIALARFFLLRGFRDKHMVKSALRWS
jgi:hypothetical protein